MKIPPTNRYRTVPPNPLTVDTPCCQCGREPSHPQIHYRFAYAAYVVGETSLAPTMRIYVASLCALCAETGSTRVRNGFLGRVQRWSALAANRDRIVRIAEYTDGDPDNETEGDACFRGGVLQSFRAISTAVETD